MTTAMAVDSPGVYPESPNDQEDVLYPCKGCGEILEEGKAFELAGNRWHIDCFRCNTCGTLLDSDANLLLLGDGSLICNNCTYSCNACGNKIEDLAILTGDQAFCASCFRCRNCKRKIENLRYARTSQGIFCMSCHESLMARRRKKAKGAPRQAQGGANGAGHVAEKALPSLPPGAAVESAFSPEIETPPSDVYSETQSSRSPRQPQLKTRKELSSSNLRRDVSPLSDEARRDGPTLPASTYGDSRPSNVSEETDDGEERGYLPMAFDPTPAPGPPPAIARKQVPRPQDASPPVQSDSRQQRDYFSGRLSAKSAQRDVPRDEQRPLSSRSVSTERDPERKPEHPKSSPHIFYQEKGRHPKRDTSGHNTPASAAASPSTITGPNGRAERPKPQHLDTGSFTLSHNEGFKLQEAPRTRKMSSRSSPNVENKSPVGISPIETQSKEEKKDKLSTSPVSVDSPSSGVNPFDDPKRKEGAAPSAAAPPPPRHADRPARGDSLTAAALRGKPSTPEPPTPTTVPTPKTESTQLAPSHSRKGSTSSIPSSFADAHSTLSRDNSRSKGAVESPPFRGSFDAPPPRASSRPTAPSRSVANGDFIAPRQPPPPPPVERHKHHDSIGTAQSTDGKSDGQLSPAMRSAGLPKHSADGGFSMEEEMARILRGDKRDTREVEYVPPSVLRRVSNAVKHGRSFSDRGLSSTGKSTSTPDGSLDISSPMTIGSPVITSPTSKEPLDQLRSQNRRQGQRIAELEAEKATLEGRLNDSADIKAATSELREKRNTMVVLDTQREMVVAELESMTNHLKKAKDSNQPLDLQSLKSDILKDFAESLQRLKAQMSAQIEDLMHKRNELTDEIGTLIQMKDKGFQEYDSLSSKNAQLLEMNNQLLHNIQETYKANRAPNGAALPGATNGLGIYHPGHKPETPGPSDVRNLNLVSTDSSMPNLLHETEAEPATVLTAPQVVNIRKGQPKKFNWRKGGEKMAKNVTKGIKGVMMGDGGVRGKEIGMPYNEIGMPYNQTHSAQTFGGSEQSSLSGKQTIDGKGGAGFGFLSQKNGGLKAGALSNMKNNNSSSNLAASVDPSVLFGSELEARCEYEKRVIPAMVTRCVEEVEARGMDVEGVYRKSGGSGQVKSVQQGFEKDGNYDISDEDLDIHAVTSALKQYFRKLPTPLITYDVYDNLLEAGQTENKEKQAHDLRMAVAQLPEHHRDCLEYLVQHLARVMQHESVNLMTPLNLSVVFAPTIMRPESIEREMSDMKAQREAVQALLEQHEAVFQMDD